MGLIVLLSRFLELDAVDLDAAQLSGELVVVHDNVRVVHLPSPRLFLKHPKLRDKLAHDFSTGVATVGRVITRQGSVPAKSYSINGK